MPQQTVQPIETVRIHYRRPGREEQLFVQHELHRDENVVVTFNERTPLTRDSRVEGRTILENGAPIIWFTFPGLWHDIGRFHLADGTFTGFYANILTPVDFVEPRRWVTTDLYLDVWLEPDRAPMILDRDEFDEALDAALLDATTARAALDEAERIRALAVEGEWPPRIVEEWTLERAIRAIEPHRTTNGEPR